MKYGHEFPKESNADAALENKDAAEFPDTADERGLTKRTPKEEISEVLDALRSVDQEIFAVQQSTERTSMRLRTLQSELGMSPTSEPSSLAAFEQERTKRLEARRRELVQQRSEWIKQYGWDNLPAGIAFENDEGNLAARGRSYNFENDQQSKENNKQEELDRRRQWFEEWKLDAVSDFERALRSDWRSKNAINLESAIQMMKNRVPKVMDNKAKDFIDGRADEPPFTAVWIQWNVASLIEEMLGTPNRINKLEMRFDDNREFIADASELEKSTDLQSFTKSDMQKPSHAEHDSQGA